MYHKLSKYYQHIFPSNPVACNFIKENALKGKPVLDIACALGDHATYMASEGFEVSGIDLSDEMIEIAAHRHPHISFELLDMMHIHKLKKSFGTIYCLGNSLVHLENSYQVESFIKICHRTLEKGGRLILQIINYDRIIRDKVTSLPTIENNVVKFVRDYNQNESGEHVEFKTTMEVEGKSYTNSVSLLMLRKEELEASLNNAGFENIHFYGSYTGGPWSSDSYATICCATK